MSRSDQMLGNSRLAQPIHWDDAQRYRQLLANPWYRLLVRLQNTVTTATMDFWRARAVTTMHLPITTSAISSPMGLGSNSLPVAIDLNGVHTYLADSMQFALEYGCRLSESGCYYVMPSFRGEDWDASHLCQFYHSEVELPGRMEGAMKAAEEYVRALASQMLHEAADDIRLYTGTIRHLEKLSDGSSTFTTLSFDDAERVLIDVEGAIESNDGSWRTLTRPGEAALRSRLGDFIWVTDWDHMAVPFYQAFSINDGRARNADLLFGVGEVIGLGERHTTREECLAALRMHDVDASPYEWYLTMKHEYPLVTSGFGMGVERYLMWVLQHDDIRDLQIFPRRNGASHTP